MDEDFRLCVYDIEGGAVPAKKAYGAIQPTRAVSSLPPPSVPRPALRDTPCPPSPLTAYMFRFVSSSPYDQHAIAHVKAKYSLLSAVADDRFEFSLDGLLVDEIPLGLWGGIMSNQPSDPTPIISLKILDIPIPVKAEAEPGDMTSQGQLAFEPMNIIALVAVLIARRAFTDELFNVQFHYAYVNCFSGSAGMATDFPWSVLSDPPCRPPTRIVRSSRQTASSSSRSGSLPNGSSGTLTVSISR